MVAADAEEDVEGVGAAARARVNPCFADHLCTGGRARCI